MRDELGHRADALHLAVGEHGDAVGDLPQQVEVVRDHDDGQAEQVAQLAHQLVDAAGAVRVEAGGRFVEKQQFRDRAPARGRARRASSCRRSVRTDTARRPRARDRSWRASRRRFHRSARRRARCARAAAGRRSPAPSASRTGRHAGTSRPSAGAARAPPRSPSVCRSTPSTRMEPESGRCSRIISRSSVDLPEPLPPISAKISARRTSRSSPACTT